MATSEPESSENKLALQVQALLWEKGHDGLDLAKKISQEKIGSKPLEEAIAYFMSSWKDVVHPALLSLSCEAVGGNPELTKPVGAALVLMAGGADIHDDVIDDSAIKYNKKTVFGKFGRELAILAGDALIVKGLCTLHDAVTILPSAQSRTAYDLVKQAFFGITSAEAEEIILMQQGSVSPEKYLRMINLKASVSEATARIGAVLGDGSTDEVETLAGFGRAFGVLMTLKDEFIDMFEVEEMKNRVHGEWLPLPILYNFKDPNKARELTVLLRQQEITEEILENMLDVVLNSKETDELKAFIQKLIDEQMSQLQSIKFNKEKLMLMINSAKEGL